MIDLGVSQSESHADPHEVARALYKLPAWLGNKIPNGYYSMYPCGSRYFGCAEAGSDYDVTVYADSEYRDTLDDYGFTSTCGEGYGHTVRSYRNGSINVLLYTDATAYTRMVAATELTRSLGDTTKQQRYDLLAIIKGETQ